MMDFIKSKNDIIDDANSKKSGKPGLSTKSPVSSLIDYKASERKVDEFLNQVSSADRAFYDKFISETQIFGDFLYLRMIERWNKRKK